MYNRSPKQELLMKRLTAAIVLTIAALVAAIHPVATAAPEPSELPESWQLDIQYDNPQPIQVAVPGESAPQTYWFMKYTVTNRTGDERIFVPEFVLYTETGQVLRSGEGVPINVFRTVKKVLNDPLLKSQSEMTGQILQGADNAKSGVAIWKDFDPKAGQVDIFVGGLSGETAVVTLPVAVTVREIDVRGKVREVEKKSIVLSKTLELTYSAPGETPARSRQPMKLLAKDWVMR
jgi:hypothetical protein